jgi:hypothetical protein
MKTVDRATLPSLALLIPDRLPSLVVLVGFWIPPAVAGWVGAGFAHGRTRHSTVTVHAVLAVFVLAYSAAWFLFNLGRMPPYIPGAVRDPTVATPEAVSGLVLFASALILPGSALACAAAFRARRQELGRASDGQA